jgi:hypothetical protein
LELRRSTAKPFSREAATAHSRGRQPTEKDQTEHVSREAAAAEDIAVAASRLWLLSVSICGLTPAAIGYRHFATQICGIRVSGCDVVFSN